MSSKLRCIKSDGCSITKMLTNAGGSVLYTLTTASISTVQYVRNKKKSYLKEANSAKIQSARDLKGNLK